MLQFKNDKKIELVTVSFSVNKNYGFRHFLSWT